MSRLVARPVDALVAGTPGTLVHEALVAAVEHGVRRRARPDQVREPTEELRGKRQRIVEVVELRDHLEENRGIALGEPVHRLTIRKTPYCLKCHEGSAFNPSQRARPATSGVS